MPFLFAFVVSILPRRYWAGATGAGILLSGLVQLAAGAAGFMEAYTHFARETSEGVASATLTVAQSGEPGGGRVEAGKAMALGALTPIGFLAVSATGWLFAYVSLSGLVRVLGAASGHPCGDPVLTFLDDLLWESGRSLLSTARDLVERARSAWGS